MELINALRKIRAKIMRKVKPKSDYLLFQPKREVRPISTKHGFDRGLPIDRYYIEKFLGENRALIKGRCLEVHDNFYLEKFGSGQVTQADALDIDKNNGKANIYGDLRNLPQVANDTYDCFVLTHTLGVIDNYQAAISESYRILKPGGVLLAVVTVSGSTNPASDYWRFTPASARYVFGQYFFPESLVIKTYGNVLSGQAHWVGLATEELTPAELDYNDPNFPIILTLKAVK